MPTADEFAALQQALAEATRRSESLVGELRVVTTERDLALERLRALQRTLFAAKSEARGSEQKDMFLNEAEALAPNDQTPPAETDEEDSTLVAGHKRKKRGRKPLDPALPREIVRHELPEADRVCAHDCHALVETGTEISEQMDVIPQQVRVLQHHHLSLKVAPVPARIIPRGLLSDAAQAWIITGKYQFGILLRDHLLDSDLVYGDETTVQVLKEPGRKAQTKSYMWAQMNGAGTGPPVRLFAYAPGRGGAHA